MQIGLCLPQLGPTAEGPKVPEVARGAEEVGYDSLWVGDRLLTLEELWNENPVEHHGRFFEIPPSRVDLRPAQPGGPPVLLAASPRRR